jgi:pescadillo
MAVTYEANQGFIKCRSISAYEKKVRKARARRNSELAKQLAQRAPSYTLDHLVRERYPTFVDALRDMDDALSMVHLFATLPADGSQQIPASVVHNSRRIALEWQAFCVRTSTLRKAFISVKGFYFQVRAQPNDAIPQVPYSVYAVAVCTGAVSAGMIPACLGRFATDLNVSLREC